MSGHWEQPLLLDDGSFGEIWRQSAGRRLLFVVGSGFDPRATVVLERLSAATSMRLDGLVIEMPEDSTDLAVRPHAEANRVNITTLVERTGGTMHSLALPAYNDSRSLGKLISRNFQQSGVLDSYVEVVLEISAMPRSIFFPLVRGVLERAHLPADDDRAWQGNLHVAVCENPEADESILEEGTTPMAAIGGFAGGRPDKPDVTIWVPVLGERASARVRVLYEELAPDETCPVLPWPSRDPRRGDRIMLEYRRLLFEDMRLEPRNVIYAAERNPFDLYRALGRLRERYVDSLSPLGEVAMVLSSHSSKLLSMGVLLTAYEYDLAVQHVSPGSYGLRDGAEILRDYDEVYDLWLTGEPYR